MGYLRMQVYQGLREAPGSSFIPRFLFPANPFPSCPTAAPQHTLTWAPLLQSLLTLNAHRTADLEIQVLPEQSCLFSGSLFLRPPLCGDTFWCFRGWAAHSAALPVFAKMAETCYVPGHGLLSLPELGLHYISLSIYLPMLGRKLKADYWQWKQVQMQ